MKILRPTNLLIVFLLALGFTLLFTGLADLAQADGGHVLTVDGVEHSPTKVVGNADDPTVHYETPDTDPLEAFSERHTWVGNGDENLPCEGGIHWIDNKNVLTISNCLEVTTTTEQATTTTTDGTTTTTEEEVTTTSTIDTTTSTENVVSTTTSPTPSTTVPTTTVATDTPSPEQPELPFTGIKDWLLPLGLALVSVGGLLVRKTGEV